VNLIWSWIVAFGRFWYRFIVGDDWTVAAAVAIGLVVTAFLNSRAIPAWWLLPLLVVVMVGVSLRRAGPPSGRDSGRPERSIGTAS
jgi:hypothetical protein